MPDHPTEILFRHEGDLLFIVSVSGDRFTCVAVNDRYVDVAGAPREYFINQSIDEMFPTIEVEYLKAQYGQAIETRSPHTYQTRTAFRGNTTYLETTLLPLFDASGDCNFLVGLSRIQEPAK